METSERSAGSGRDAFRAALVARIPRWYSPWAHVAFPSLFALAVGVLMARLIDGLKPFELVTIPIVLLVANATEWRLHKYVLHRRVPLLEVIYDRHTPEHHRVFVMEDMAIRSPREYRLVLVPAAGIAGIVLMDTPFAIALWLLGLRNVACLFVATSALYFVSYELLHLAYHLPVGSRIGASRLIARLRRHHAVHHCPALMQRWNFNVTLPLWDWVRGTTFHGEVPSGQAGGQAGDPAAG